MDSLVRVFNADQSEFNIRRSEILRYMQYPIGNDISDVEELINSCISEFTAAAEYKACYCKFNIKQATDDCIDFGFMKVKSSALTANLKGCHEVYAFAATTGIKAERLLNKYNRISPGRAFIFDAIGSASIEAFCDYLNDYLREKSEKSGHFLRPRFSPGYGDFPIEHQPDLIRVLDANRKLNLTLTDSLLMVPTKSVTAIIGISDTPNTCRAISCDGCIKNDCRYRK